MDLCYFVIISSWKGAWKGRGPLFEQTWIPIAQECFVQSFVDIGPVILEKKTLKFRQCIYTISLLSPLRKERGSSLSDLELSSHKDALCQVLLKLA